MMLGFVFPGQGSQAIGMLASLAQSSPCVADTFATASKVLGYDLWRLAQEGPEDRLNATEQTQPAMLAADIAVLRAWQEAGGPAAAILAGHSLGEYAALVCAGTLEFADAVALVAERARCMQSAVPEGVGAMAAVLGLDDDQVATICAEAQVDEVVAPANFNAPGQVVIAGNASAVQRALDAARGAGAKRAIRLPLSVPSHCRLMEPAARAYAKHLAGVELRSPAIPVLHNVDVDVHPRPEGLRDVLAEQLSHPVRWTDTVLEMRRRGVDLLVEIGPGRVLTGLARRIDRDLEAAAVHDPASLVSALSAARSPARPAGR